MKRKNTTRNALFTSIISLLLCVSMLVGTTFAWFTDEVKSGTNVIAAGNLDVEVYHGDPAKKDSITDEASLFNEITYWEPGVVAYENLTVVNEGSLALKYQMKVNFTNASVAKNGKTLADALQIAVVKGGIDTTTYPATTAGRTQLVADLAGKWQPLASFVQNGKLDSDKDLLTDAETADTYGLVIYWQPTANDNDFNMNNTDQGKTLTIDLGVHLLATQLEAEDDSFGTDYDKDAAYPGHSTSTAPEGSVGTFQPMELSTEGNNPATVTIPAPVVQDLAATASKIEVRATGFEANIASGVVSYDDLGLYDQNGNEIDLTGNTEPIEVKLFVGTELAGKTAIIYHDGNVVATAVVDAAGYVTYNTLHFCAVTVKTQEATDNVGDLVVGGEIVEELPEDIELKDTDIIQMLVGEHYYDVSVGMAKSWYEYPNVPGKIEAKIYVPEDLLAFSLMYKNGDLAETGSHSDLTIVNDLDFANINWAPIGRFFTNIHGEGRTISNLNDSLLGCVYDCQIDNLTIKNVTASGSASGVIAKELAGDTFLTDVTIAGTNTVTYKPDSASNWPEGGTGVGAICGVSLIGYTGQGSVDVDITGTIKVNYNGIVVGNTTNRDNLGVTKEFGLNVYQPNIKANITGSNNITTEGECRMVTDFEGITRNAFNAKQYYIESKAGLMNLNSLLAEISTSEANIITVDLETDVDLAGETWDPIHYMWVVFNGNEHTISNINAGFDATGRRSGFWGYAGAVTINDLTLENVTVSGSQAGTFAGAAEGLKVNNCYLKGDNTVNFVAGVETWNGIGAITGVLTNSTVNVEIVEGATVALNTNGMTTDPGCTFVDDLTGYIQANKGTVTNNGTIIMNLYVTNDAELTAALNASKMYNAYWNKQVNVYLAAGEYSADYIINQYPEWNGSMGQASNLNGKAGTANVTHLTFEGTEGTIFTGNVTVAGFGAASNGFTAAKATTVFKNITFNAANSVEANGKDYIVVYMNAAASGVTFDGCDFEDATHITIGGSSHNGIGKVTFTGCTFDNGNCLSGYCETLTVTGSTVNNAYKGFISNQKAGNVTVKNSNITCSEYAFRTQNSGININVTDSNITVSGYEDVDALVCFRGSGHTATFKDCELSYEAAQSGTGTGVLIIDGAVQKSASDESELAAAISSGDVNVSLSNGTYKMPSSSSTGEIKITGTKDAVLDMTMGAYMDSATVTIEGVTIKTGTGYANGNGSDYAALYTPNVTYKNCTFIGPMRIGRDGAKFINCAFTGLGNDYIWTNGNDVTFEGCTFNTDGKAILIYSDGGNEVSLVTVKDCVFNSTTGAKAGAIANQNCAAIEIHNYGNGVNLTTSGNTYDSNFSGEWRIKTYETGRTQVLVNGTEYTTIALDGKLMTIDANKNVTVQ